MNRFKNKIASPKAASNTFSDLIEIDLLYVDEADISSDLYEHGVEFSREVHELWDDDFDLDDGEIDLSMLSPEKLN